MRRLIPLLFLLGLTAPAVLWAQKPPAGEQKPNGDRLQSSGCDPATEKRSADRRRLYEILQSMVELANSLNAERQLLQRLEELLGVYRGSGLEDMHYVSSALVRMAVQLRGQGRQDVAQEFIQAALELWPGNKDAYEVRARVYLDGGVVGMPLAVLARLQGFLVNFDDFWRGLFVAHAALFWLCLVLGAIFLIWTLSWAIIYYQLWCHDIAELIGSVPLSLLIGAALPVLPLLLGQGLLWSLLILLVLCWPYGARLERGLMALIGVALLAAPTVARQASAAFHLYEEPMAHVLAYVEEGEEWNEVVWNELATLSAKSRRDPMPHFLLGNLYYQSRCYFDAADRYQQALGVNRNFAQAMNNLANTVYQQGNVDGAIVKYQQAAKVGPDLCSPLINLNLAFNEKFEFDAAAKVLDQAKEACPDAVSRQIERDLSHGDKHDAVLMEGVQPQEELTLLYEAAVEVPDLTEDLWPARLAGVPLSGLPPLALGLLAAFLIRSTVLNVGRKTRYCLKCSRPTCPKCQLVQASQLYCGQCVRLFILRSGIDAQVQKEGILRTNLQQQRAMTRAKMLNLVLPGGGHLLAGRRLAGILLLTAWAALWAFYLRPELPVFSHLDVFYSPRQFLNSVLILLAALVWALANLAVPIQE